MEPQFDSSGQPVPQAFQRAVAQYAGAMGLPAEELIRGEGFSYDDTRFWLMHYGQDDPDGATVMMDVAEPPEDPKAVLAITGPFLQFHAMLPIVLHGYYGYIPNLNRLVYCTRIALDEAEDGAVAIAATIARYADLRRDVLAALAEPTPQHARASAPPV